MEDHHETSIHFSFSRSNHFSNFTLKQRRGISILITASQSHNYLV